MFFFMIMLLVVIVDSGVMLNWIKSYVSERYETVKICKQESDCGPNLFLKVLPKCSDSNVLVFADDIKLFRSDLDFLWYLYKTGYSFVNK